HTIGAAGRSNQQIRVKDAGNPDGGEFRGLEPAAWGQFPGVRNKLGADAKRGDIDEGGEGPPAVCDVGLSWGSPGKSEDEQQTSEDKPRAVIMHPHDFSP